MDNILKKLESELDNIVSSNSVKESTVGTVYRIEDVIVLAKGLDDLSYGELVLFERTKILGMALDLNEETTGLIVLGDHTQIKGNDKIIALNKQLSIEVSEDILGKHIDALGNAKDGSKIDLKNSKSMELERIAAGVIDRQPVSRPLQTGILSIDSIIPIGRGQRELIIGDRQTGKTAIAIDTILNQKDQKIICIYVSIGQKSSKIARIVDTLNKYDSMEYSIVVSATASEPASMQYLAPYTGVAIAEYFMEQGKDVLVIYDDLTKHAWAYRELSLLLQRPPGREAYPGDVFYLHSRLLERAVQLSEELGGGSITALPIIETQAGDLSAYIPTNVISITDGQVFLESEMFNSGIKPAINAGLSVSRVGGSAQLKAMKQVSGQLRLEFAQYTELAAFAQFGSDLDKETQRKLDRGARLVELMKQNQYSPYSFAHEVIILYAATKNNYIEKVGTKDIKNWIEELIRIVDTSYASLLERITTEKKLSEELEKDINEVIESSLSKYTA